MCKVHKLLKQARDLKKNNTDKGGFELYNDFDTLNKIKELNKKCRMFALTKTLKIFDFSPDLFSSIQIKNRIECDIFSEQEMEKIKKRLEQWRKKRGI